jgi:hypothetical protein
MMNIQENATTIQMVPIAHEEENKAFAKLVLNGKGTIDFDVAAVEWCKYVDSKNIMPKLPSQLELTMRRGLGISASKRA